MIDQRRLKTEIGPLEDKFPNVESDLDAGWIRLEGVAFPKGWNHRVSMILLEVDDPYPGSQPEAFIPEKMRYKGEIPENMLLSPFKPGWSKLCIHNLADRFDPSYHTLVTMVRLVEVTLNYPNDENPFK